MNKSGLAFAPSHSKCLQIQENSAKCLRRVVPPSMLLSHRQQGKPLPGSAAAGRSTVQGRRAVAMKEGGDKGGKKGDDDEEGTFIDDIFKPLVA